MNYPMLVKGFLILFFLPVLLLPGLQAQNVGIGTETPSQKLDVAGNIKLGDNIMVEGDQSSIKVYRNLASYASYYGTSGAFAIHTNQPVSGLQWAMVVEGYVWSPLRLFKIYMAGYEDAPSAGGCIYEGTDKLPVRIGRETDKLVLVIGDTNVIYGFPQLVVTEFQQCYSNLNEGYADGWSINLVTSLSGFSNMSVLPERSHQQWAENGSDIYRLSGNVGIGLNNPSSLLEVRTNSNIAGSKVLMSINESNGTAADQWAIRGEVRSTATQTAGGGILGIHNSTTGTACGIRGDTYSPSGTGIFGVGWATSGASIATRGFNLSPDGYGGHFVGAKNYFSGNLGIGIENPAFKLHVRNGYMMISDNVPYVEFNIADGGSSGGLHFLQDSISRGYIFYTHTAEGRFIKLSNHWWALYNELIIDTLGHIGINTEYDDLPERLNVGGTSRTGVNSSTDGAAKYGVYGINTVNSHYGVLGSANYGAEGCIGTLSAGAYGVLGKGPNSVTGAGTAYTPTGSLGGVKGMNAISSSYVFGVSGFTDFTQTRSGGCLGAFETGTVWGCLAYRESTGTSYGGYFTSSTTGTGDRAGKTSGIYENKGIGAYGELFGADIHGDIYGTFTEGERYGLYSNGDLYRNGLDVHLQMDAGTQKVLYTHVSTDVTVQTSGIGTLSEGRCMVSFDRNFSDVVSQNAPVIVSVTPIGESTGLHLAELGPEGFVVQENQAGRSNVQFTYIAIGRRKGFENPHPADEVVAPDYLEKLSRGMSNDNNLASEGERLIFQNGKLSIGLVKKDDFATESIADDLDNNPESKDLKRGDEVRK